MIPDPHSPRKAGRIAAIADDFTGATDVAVAFRRAGLTVRIVFGVPTGSVPTREHDALVIALKTRTIPAADAVRQSLASARWAKRQGFDRFYFKYCSTFDSSPRGNIGPVADALADELGAELAVVTPASPLHGRTVYQGYLFVNGQLLSESPLRTHPLTPMTDSNLLRLLSAQTRRPVGQVTHQVVSRGAAAVTAELEALRATGVRYAIVDALDDDELRQLGSACLPYVLVTGAAGLAAGLASAIAGQDLGTPAGPSEGDWRDYRSAAVIAGSCSARTVEQVAFMAAINPSYRLDAVAIPDSAGLADSALAWFDSLTKPHRVPLFYSSLPADQLRHVQDRLGVEAAAELVEGALGRIAQGLVARGVDRLVIAGGETSGSVTTALGVTTGSIGSEAALGVPWIFVDGERPLALLLKSGNFGDADLLVAASAPG
ncbi:MAG: 3-oxo-tetronate kinase [Microbacteriaceae bacterium]